VAEIEFMLRFADAGHHAGYPSADLEARVLKLAESSGIEDAQISATPTIIELSFGPIRTSGRSRSASSRPQSLDALSRLDELVLRMLDHRLTPPKGCTS
jgi:uncharacterized membrane protein YjjP (DUF1212 family)